MVPGAAVEVDLEALLALEPGDTPFAEVSRFPQIRRDLAVIVDRDVAAGEILAALQRSAALREHIGLGLDNGLTPREICETFFQCAIYAGFPTCVHAMEIAHDVFEERGVGE